MDFIESGVPNLDLVLGGGLVAGSLVMVTGEPGCGKTILTQQIAFHAAARGEQVLILTTLSEPHLKLLGYLGTLAFFDEGLVGQRIELLNIYRQLQDDFANVGATIVRLVRERRASLLVLDSFDSVRDLAPNEVAAKELIYELSAGLGLLGVTTLVVAAAPGAPYAPELAIADTIIALRHEHHGARTLATLEVTKMRGAAQRNGRHAYRITAAGVEVYPRQETVPPPAAAPAGGRVPFDLPALDAMLDGGPPAGDSTAIVGDPGAGKTLLALQFVLAGARRGERVLFVSFQETRRQLLAKAAALGLEIPAALAAHDGAIIHYVPADLDADAVLADVRRRIAAGVTRLAIDTLPDLLGGVPDAGRRPGFVAALLAYARAAGVTTCFTRVIAAGAPPGEGVARADNTMLLRRVERGAGTLAVLTMRHSDHAPAPRAFTIRPGGMMIVD